MLFLTFFVSFNSILFAQKDTLAKVIIKNIELSTYNTLKFDMYLSRTSEKWLAYANSTFQIGFADTNIRFNNSNLVVNLDKTDLPLVTNPGNLLPIDAYLIEPKVFDNRISITIVGPEKYDDCIKIQRNNDILIGSFSIVLNDTNRLNDDIVWLNPQYWYNGLAYKIEKDSLINNSIPFYYAHDNIEMDYGNENTYLLEIIKNTDEKFVFDNFWVIYHGQKVDSLGWRTKVEKNVIGYYVLKAVKTSIFELEYKQLVGTYDINSPKYNPDYLSKGNSKTGFTYVPFWDTVDYRGGEYCYALHAVLSRSDGSRYDTLLAERCVEIPNAVISKANPLKNPFSIQTTIELVLEDDCYVSGFATDELGKYLKPLSNNDLKMDKLMMKKGTYYIDFNASEFASQGLYNCIFIAYPIKDPNIELSKAVVKLQHVRESY